MVKIWLEQEIVQFYAAATMSFTTLTVTHEANCCGELSPRRVAVTYRLMGPDTEVNRCFSIFEIVR